MVSSEDDKIERSHSDDGRVRGLAIPRSAPSSELAESSASGQTIMSGAGHVSQRMLSHYSHVQLERKREGLNALSSGAQSVVTAQTASRPESLVPQVLKNLVDVTGIEPVTPCLQSTKLASNNSTGDF